MLVWLNGTLTEEASIPVTDRGFTLGDGVFETILVDHGAACHWPRHCERLAEGAAVLGIPFDRAAGATAVRQVLEANRTEFGSVRLTLSRGGGARGLAVPPDPRPTLVAGVTTRSGQLAAPLSPVRVVTVRRTRRNEFSPLARIKSLNMLDNVLARAEAAEAGADEAILLNTAGRVAEAAAANIVVLLEGRLTTPPVTDGVLPGILRALALERLGVVERSLSPDDLARAEAVALTNSLSIQAVGRLDDRNLDGEAARALAAALFPLLTAGGDRSGSHPTGAFPPR